MVKSPMRPADKLRTIAGFLPNLSENIPKGTVTIKETKALTDDSIPISIFGAWKYSSAYMDTSEKPVFIAIALNKPTMNIVENLLFCLLKFWFSDFFD